MVDRALFYLWIMITAVTNFLGITEPVVYVPNQCYLNFFLTDPMYYNQFRQSYFFFQRHLGALYIHPELFVDNLNYRLYERSNLITARFMDYLDNVPYSIWLLEQFLYACEEPYMFRITNRAEYIRYAQASYESIERMSNAHGNEAYNAVLRSHPFPTEMRDAYAEEVRWEAYFRSKKALMNNSDIRNIVIEERFHNRRATLLSLHFKR